MKGCVWDSTDLVPPQLPRTKNNIYMLEKKVRNVLIHGSIILNIITLP